MSRFFGGRLAWPLCRFIWFLRGHLNFPPPNERARDYTDAFRPVQSAGETYFNLKPMIGKQILRQGEGARMGPRLADSPHARPPGSYPRGTGTGATQPGARCSAATLV